MVELNFTTGTGLVRTDDHRYYWQDQGPFPGVTTVQKVLYTGEGLVNWAKGMVAEYAVQNAYKTAWLVQEGKGDEAVTFLKKLPERARDKAADLGSSVHWHAEQIAVGHDVPVPAEEWPFIRQYLAWRDDWQPTYLAVEYMGVNLTHRYGGTGDLIVEHRGENWLLDIKSGRYYDETALQLVACAEFDFIGEAGDVTQYPVPRVDRFGVLDLKPDGWKVIPYEFDRAATFEAFARLAAIYHWKQGFKRVRRPAIEGRAEEETTNDAA